MAVLLRVAVRMPEAPRREQPLRLLARPSLAAGAAGAALNGVA